MNVPDRDKFLREIRSLSLPQIDPYIRVYPSFLNFFSKCATITKDDFVVAANFSYGWMPTMLHLAGDDNDWAKGASILASAREARLSSTVEVEFLMGLINNSLVGVSKILHFVNPWQHAIWDGRVYRYLTKEEPHGNRVNNADKFSRYLEICDEIAQWPELPVEIARLSKEVGQNLTPFRVIERTMWANGGKR